MQSKQHHTSSALKTWKTVMVTAADVDGMKSASTNIDRLKATYDNHNPNNTRRHISFLQDIFI